jgi:hypothetical protein
MPTDADLPYGAFFGDIAPPPTPDRPGPKKSGLFNIRPFPLAYGEGTWYNTDLNRLDYCTGTTWIDGVTGGGGGGMKTPIQQKGVYISAGATQVLPAGNGSNMMFQPNLTVITQSVGADYNSTDQPGLTFGTTSAASGTLNYPDLSATYVLWYSLAGTGASAGDHGKAVTARILGATTREFRLGLIDADGNLQIEGTMTDFTFPMYSNPSITFQMSTNALTVDMTFSGLSLIVQELG